MLKQRKNGIVLNYLGTGLNMLCGLFLSSYLIRKLGDTEYGIYQTVCAFANYLVLLEFGVGTVVTRNIAVCRTKNASDYEIKKNISTVWTINVLLGVLITIVAIVFYCCIDDIYHSSLSFQQIVYAKQIFVFEVIYLVVSFLTTTLTGLLLGYEEYGIGPAVSIFRIVSRTILITFFAISWKKVIIVAVIDSVLSVIILLFLEAYCRRKLSVRLSFKYFDMEIFRNALPLCFALFLQVIVNQANNNVDKFVISLMLNPESVAVYSIGLYVYSMFSSLTTIPITMYAPQVITDVANEVDNKTLEDRMIIPSRLVAIIGGTVLFGFGAVGRQFVSLLYGEQYMVAWTVALIIMFPMLINMSNGIIINILDAKNLRIVRSLALLFTTIINICLTVCWVKHWGMVGASVATAISTILGQILLMNLFYVKRLKINVMRMFRETFKGVFLYQVVAGIISFIIANTIKSDALSFVIGGVVFVVIFFFLYYRFGARDEEKQMIDSLYRKVLSFGVQI